MFDKATWVPFRFLRVIFFLTTHKMKRAWSVNEQISVWFIAVVFCLVHIQNLVNNYLNWDCWSRIWPLFHGLSFRSENKRRPFYQAHCCACSETKLYLICIHKDQTGDRWSYYRNYSNLTRSLEKIELTFQLFRSWIIFDFDDASIVSLGLCFNFILKTCIALNSFGTVESKWYKYSK